jgi:hypothetical protein
MPEMERGAGFGRRLTRGLVGVACAALLAWMSLAIFFSPLEPAWMRVGLAALPFSSVIAALFLVRPLRRVPIGVACAFVLVLGAWLAIPPSHDRSWQPDVATLPYAEIDGDQVVVHNVRNTEYRSESDFTVRLEDRELDLSQLRSLDLFLIYWGSPWIAHTIMSFGFEDGQYLAISIETRKEEGESYSAIRGFFRKYELVYVVADERDVIGLRTNLRGEDVYVYRLDTPPEVRRLLLLAYLDAVNQLYERPEWYNALVHNCTTTIQHLAAPHQQRSWWSWQLLANGHLDELAYEIGAIDRSLPFSELKKLSNINERARAAGVGPGFSKRIREGVPRMAQKPGA